MINTLPEYNELLYHAKILTEEQFKEYWDDVQRNYEHDIKQEPHYFNAPEENKESRFCRCGKYLTDKIHSR